MTPSEHLKEIESYMGMKTPREFCLRFDTLIANNLDEQQQLNIPQIKLRVREVMQHEEDHKDFLKELVTKHRKANDQHARTQRALERAKEALTRMTGYNGDLFDIASDTLREIEAIERGEE